MATSAHGGESGKSVSASGLVVPESRLVVPAENEGRWYVAHTRSRNEKILAEEMARMRIFSYLPLTERVTRSAVTRRISRSVVPVFPGYVFFLATEEQRYLALRTNRIAQVLSVPDQRQLVSELRQIHHLLASTNEFRVASRLEVGDWVRVIAGPLRGLEGVVTRRADRWRLHLNVTTLGQSVHVEISADHVEKTDPPEGAGSIGQSTFRRQ